MATNAQSAPSDDPAAAILECLNTVDTHGSDPVGPYKGHSNLSTIEIWQYSTVVPETDLKIQEIETLDLRQWVDRLPTKKAGLEPVAGLKLLIGDAVLLNEDMPALEIRREMRDSIRYLTRSFNVPSILCAADDHNARFWHLPQPAILGFEANESYYANLHDLAVVWTVNPQSRVTFGVLLFCSPGPRHCRGRLLANLERVKSMVHQPVVFPFVLAETAAHVSSNQLRRLGTHISTVDSSIETFYEEEGVRGAVELTGFSAGTTFRAAQVAKSQRGLHASLELVRHFLQSRAQPRSTLSHHDQKTLQFECSAIESGLRCVKQTIESLILSAETYQTRMSNQIALILSLFSQEDQSIGIDIAKASKSIALESKRDSSSMKTLAVVTMLFLPGTFIASFFAMPLFDWQAPRGQVVDSRLWIYFVVTIPLTGFMCAVWWAWFTLKTRRQRKENENVLKDSGSRGGSDVESGGIGASGSKRDSVHLFHSIRPRASR